MAPTKSKRASPRWYFSRSRPIDPIKPDDPIPSSVIDSILALPSSSEERPLKRRKLDPGLDLFCVATGSISLERRCSYDGPADYVERRSDVGPYLVIVLHPEHQELEIESRSHKGSNPVRVKFSLSREDSRGNVESILRLASCSKTGSPGSIWNKIDISVARKGSQVAIDVELQLYWNATPSPANGFRRMDHRKVTNQLIDTFYPTSGAPLAARSPMDFYDAAFVPDKDDPLPLSIDIPAMDATLFPYQKRTLQWLLKREGVQWSGQRRVEPSDEDLPTPLSDSSRTVQDAQGRDMLLNDVFHTVAADHAPCRAIESHTRGGILAEEMGLGKTLEILGLILLHTRSPAELLDAGGSNKTRIASGATLIVTPESLRQQWLSEIARHAPGLRVEFYQGCKRESGEGDKIARRLANCDVVVTTYSILSAEVHFAREAPDRSRRRERKYEPKKSPLVQVLWWRLCLDEAQMIENGISQAAEVARTIPRVNAWGITGTPVKDDVNDLYGLLSFLRYEPLCSAPQLWSALLRDHKPVFQKLFNTIALRHTKALVRDEIALPAQRRYAISVPFSAVEEQHYQSLYSEMTEACGLDAQGCPVVEGWSPEVYEEPMRIWLNRLRQTALHPEVGAYSRRILGQKKSRPMRTVEEVLNAMLEQSDNATRAAHRALLSSKLIRGQLFENSPRVREALEIWEEVRKEADKMVADGRAELQAATGREVGHDTDGLSSGSPEDSEDSEEESEEPEFKARIGELRRKLRSALELQHKAVFFCANAYFQIRDNEDMTTPDSEEFNRLKKLEDEAYERAKSIRREILRESHEKATRLMDKIARKASEQSFTELAELTVKSHRGIESSHVIDDLETLYGGLNQQANAIDEWREHAVQLMLKALLDEEDEGETTGEEMVDAAKIQDEIVIYLQVLRAAIADRQDAMTGQVNERVDHETKTSTRMAQDGEGPMPEKLLVLFQRRAEIKPQAANISMRGAISLLRALITKLRNEHSQTERVRVELAIATEQLQATQAALTEQTKAATSLDAEIESFRTTINARIEYYRQLQSVSDSVLPYEGPKTEVELARIAKAEERLKNKLAAAEAKHRYLLHLKEAGSKSDEPRMCVICQASFELGVLTICGHQFCKECMMQWFKAHRNCPVCKRHLNMSEMHDIAMKPQELRLHGDGFDREAESSSPRGRQNGLDKKSVIYSTFNAEKLAEIRNIELDGPSYTSKVDTLVRHLLWLRESDPGAKSIVFSQYKDFLGVLAVAFDRFRIGFSSIDTHGGATRFKEDPAIEVFLLHARAHSSGLNLVNANHVFLCEPLVNTALELQAIARVDRIGQMHETSVYLYVTAGTVEESIYNLSVKRRIEHMGRQKQQHRQHGADEDGNRGKSGDATPDLQMLDPSRLDAANTLELERAALTKLMSKDRTAGELVDSGDLWECLFGHVAGSVRPQGF